MLRKPKFPNSVRFDKVDSTKRQRRTFLKMKPPVTGFERSERKPKVLIEFNKEQSKVIGRMLKRKKRQRFKQYEPPIREQILQTSHAEEFQQLTPKQQEETINHINSMKKTFATYGQEIPFEKLVKLALTAVAEKQ